MSGDFACASNHKAGPYDIKVTEHFMTLLNNAQVHGGLLQGR